MPDLPMKLTKIVTRNRGVHMMIGVIVHVPVQKPNEWTENYGTATETEIGHFIYQTDMLQLVAEKT